MDTEKKISFGEVDANFLYSAVRYQLKSLTWDVEDETSWEHLKALKDLQARLEQYLEGQ